MIGSKLTAGLLFAALVLASGRAAAQSWADTPWAVGCENPEPCAPADDFYEPMLVHASQWLQGLGFRAPAIAPNEDHPGAYYAAISDAEPEEARGIGMYDAPTKRILLRADFFFTLGEPGQDFDTPAFQALVVHEATPVHELFHAVQSGYHDLAAAPDGQRWIWEGSAGAVQMAYAQEFRADVEVSRRLRVSYTTPLHEPGDAGEVHGTWRFFRDIGVQIGSPSTIGYLHDVFRQNLAANNGLDGVDQALRAHGGLHAQLPRFFAGLGEYFEYNFEPETHRADLPADQDRREHRFPLRVREVAGKGARVEVSTPTGGPVQVRFSMQPDHPDLHLIVDGRLVGENGAISGNQYEELLAEGGDKTYDVIVANVAERASASIQRDVQLRVELTKSQCATPGLGGFQLSGALPASADMPSAPRADVRWDVTNFAGRMVCNGLSLPLAPSRARGTLEILDGGRTIIGTGFAEGSAPVTMHAVPGLGGRYAGSVEASQDGIPMTIDFCWQVITDSWITGFLRSNVSAQGMTCNMSRDFELKSNGP